MQVTNLIAAHILQVYEGDNWTDVSIAQTLNNISYQQAQQQTPGSPNTIAGILHHLLFWNEIMLQRINEHIPSIPDINGFDVNHLENEADWNALKEKVHQSFKQLADAVKNFQEEKLNQPCAGDRSSYYKNLQGIVEHAHYHLGQIVIIKNLLQKEVV